MKDNEFVKINFREVCEDINKRGFFTHFFHRYPGKLIPHIPYYFLVKRKICPTNGIVLDPFCGSGTVLLESMLAGYNSVGIDCNPLSVLISQVKTTSLEKTKIEKLKNKILRAYINDVVDFSMYNLKYWFTPKKLNELARILVNIIKIENPEYRKFFLVCFSSILRKCSLADPKVTVPLKSSKACVNSLYRGNEIPQKLFSLKVDDIISKMERLSQIMTNPSPKTTVKIGDAKKLKIKDDSIDVVITSPPYINAHHYARIFKLELEFLNLYRGDKIQKLGKMMIGSEQVNFEKNKKPPQLCISELDKKISFVYNKSFKKAYIIYKYYVDMTKVINEIHRVLKPGGYFVLVIGNNKIAGIEINNAEYLSEIAEKSGFNVIEKYIDIIKSRGLMTKRNKGSNIIKEEKIILFQKSIRRRNL